MQFKIDADFECNFLKKFRLIKNVMILHTPKNIRNIFVAVLLMKLFVLMINLASQLFFTGEKMCFIKLLKQFLKSILQKIYKKAI